MRSIQGKAATAITLALAVIVSGGGGGGFAFAYDSPPTPQQTESVATLQRLRSISNCAWSCEAVYRLDHPTKPTTYVIPGSPQDGPFGSFLDPYLTGGQELRFFSGSFGFSLRVGSASSSSRSRSRSRVTLP